MFLVYELALGNINLVYIGSSGKMKNNGTIKHRNGGLYDQIVNGEHFGISRSTSWPDKIKQDRTDALDVYWYETVYKGQYDIPSVIEALIIQRHFVVHGSLPKWNLEF